MTAICDGRARSGVQVIALRSLQPHGAFASVFLGCTALESVVHGEPRKRVVGHLRESTSASLPQIETMDMTRRSRSARPRVATTKRRHAVLRVEATETGEENASTPGG